MHISTEWINAHVVNLFLIYNIPIDMISGTSIGAVIGALYSSEPNAKKLEKDALAMNWDWQPISFGPDVRVVDDVEDPDAVVEYHGVLMSADWPQEIEDAQELKGYVMHGQPLNRVKHSAAGDAGEHGELCQECGVLKGQFHVPGCHQEDCPRCAGKLVECSCEIDID